MGDFNYELQRRASAASVLTGRVKGRGLESSSSFQQRLELEFSDDDEDAVAEGMRTASSTVATHVVAACRTYEEARGGLVVVNPLVVGSGG